MQRLLIGIFIIIIGVFLLLELAGTLSADSVIRDLWPMVLVFVGVVMATSKEMSFFGWILFAFGLIMLLRTTGIGDTALGEWLIPIFLLLLGLMALNSIPRKKLN